MGSSLIGSTTVYKTVDGRLPLNTRVADSASKDRRGIIKRLLKFKRANKSDNFRI